MTKKFYSMDEQKKLKIKGAVYKTLKEARATARKYGEDFTAVRAMDLYTGIFIGYTVERQ